MKAIVLTVALLLCGSVAAQVVPVEEAQRRLMEKSQAATQAAGDQKDSDSLKKSNSTMREELEKTKKQNSELKAELARYEKAKASPVPTIPISIGMTIADAEAAFTLNRWQRETDSSQSKIDKVETWRNPYGKDYRTDYHAAEVDPRHFAVGAREDDPKPGQPYKVVFKGGVVTRIDKSK